MKKLQQNFTTTEQSKRLLELGVPEDSADLVIESGCDVRKTIPSRTVFTKWCQNRRDYSVDYEKFMPCWSVGRLIEIYHICVSRGFSFNVCFPNLMNEIMYKLAEANSNGWLDLKKLEE